MAIYTLMLLDICICELYTCETAQSRPSAHQLPQLISGECQYAFFQVIFKQTYKTYNHTYKNILYTSPHAVAMGLLGDILVYVPCKL